MNIAGRVEAVTRHLALSAGVALAVMMVALAGLGFLIFGYYNWLLTRFGVPASAAIAGATLLGLAIVIGVIGKLVVRKLKKPQPGLLAEFGGTLGLGLRLASLLVRRDPKKAVIIATLSGAIAEYLLSDSKK